jgi:hypothetical protein
MADLHRYGRGRLWLRGRRGQGLVECDIYTYECIIIREILESLGMHAGGGVKWRPDKERTVLSA